jgi:predicted transcriptional regulator
MFEDTLELAENKLLLLYIINRLNLPVSNAQLTELVLKNNLMNYFILQQYIDELASSEFLRYTDTSGRKRLMISEKGKKVLELFGDRVSEKKCGIVNEYIEKNWDDLKKDMTVTADYTIEKKDNFIVNLKAMEKDALLIDIRINVPSNKQARDLCAKWKEKCPELYEKITDILTEDIAPTS